MAKPDPMGATFAERAAAAAGQSSFTDPRQDPAEAEDNSTFGSRAPTKKASSKAVKSDDAEDKAVSSGRSSAKKK